MGLPMPIVIEKKHSRDLVLVQNIGKPFGSVNAPLLSGCGQIRLPGRTHVYTHIYTDVGTHVYTHVNTHVYTHMCLRMNFNISQTWRYTAHGACIMGVKPQPFVSDRWHTHRGHNYILGIADGMSIAWVGACRYSK